jgi:ketosteroid isomerase-like protein
VARQNVALVREIVDALNRRDLDAALSWAAPEVEYDLSRTESPLRGVYRGVDRVRQVAEEFYAPWDSVHYEAQELIEAGDQVVMPYTSRFVGRQGIELTAEATWVFTIDEGCFTRLVLYQDQAEAMRAAGAERGATGTTSGRHSS